MLDGPFFDGGLERQFDRLWRTDGSRFHQPPAALEEEPDGFRLFVDLPGVRARDVVIVASSHAILISGVRHTPLTGVVRQSAPSSGDFRIDIRFSWPIAAQATVGELVGGVLHVWLPKITTGSAEQEKT